MILSQLIRGAAEELVSRPGELVDPTLIGAAMARAAQRAYASVREPAEGTMLTVMRDMAAAAASELAHMRDPRLAPGRRRRTCRTRAIADILERALAEGEQSLKRGPELLPILKASGVVDAGGYGVIVVFAGVIAALRGDEAPELEHHAPARITHPEHASETFRFCTNFAVTGTGLEPAPFRDALEALGDSVLVVGDAHTLKVHVHTDDPEQAMAVFAGAGEVSTARRRRHARPGVRAPAGRRLGRPARGRSGRRSTSAAASWPSPPARACTSCSGRSARTSSTAARRSTRRPRSCWPASTTSPPRRSSCCPTART